MPYCCNCGKELSCDKDILCPDCRKKLNSAAEANLEKTSNNKKIERSEKLSYPFYFGSDYNNPCPWETPSRGLGQAVTGFIFGLISLIFVTAPFIVSFFASFANEGVDLGGISVLSVPLAVVGLVLGIVSKKSYKKYTMLGVYKDKSINSLSTSAIVLSSVSLGIIAILFLLGMGFLWFIAFLFAIFFKVPGGV